MSATSRVVYLRIALVIIGLLCIFGFYPLTFVWPSGWAWGQGHSHYSAFGGGPENYKITAGRYPITPLANRREILSPRLTRLGAEQSESFSCARTDMRGERVVVRMVMLGSYRLRTMWVA